MSKKIKFPQKQSAPSSPLLSSLPKTIPLINLNNRQNPTDLSLLKERIEELEYKVIELQSKIKLKRKRIRRKSNEVQKKFKCDLCKKLYGSVVSRNLHLRIKHNKQKQELDSKAKEQTLIKTTKINK